MNVQIAQLQALLNIAARAIEADDEELLAKCEAADISSAYDEHKERNGIQRIERGTPEWEAMMSATKGEFAAAEAAKRNAKNAKRRLKTAITKYRNT